MAKNLKAGSKSVEKNKVKLALMADWQLSKFPTLLEQHYSFNFHFFAKFLKAYINCKNKISMERSKIRGKNRV